MGCGQSKINIYPKKSKGKNSSKKSVTGDKPEGGEEEDGAENERNANEQSDDEGSDECDSKKKPGRTKPIGNVGGPLLAQTELSNSQHNFFKMLDEKIENGPDYDSNDETEIALETARLHTLLKDWETASASSRSLPSTPRHGSRQQQHPQERNIHSAPKQQQQHTRIPPNVIHQTYGVTPPMAYRQTNYNPTYQTHSPTHTPPYLPPNVSKMQPGIQYQEYQEYQEYQTPSYQMHHQNYLPRQYTHPLPNTIATNAVPSSGSPVHYQPNNSPKHKYPPVAASHQAHQVGPSIGYVAQGSPTHKLYAGSQPAGYTNGELIIQQQLYNQQLQYQQSREYQQYRQNREQLLVQQQICGTPGIPQGGYSVGVPVGVPVGVGVGVPNPARGSHYQSSVHVPIVAVLPQNDQSPKMLQRKQQQRQYSQEMT